MTTKRIGAENSETYWSGKPENLLDRKAWTLYWSEKP